VGSVVSAKNEGCLLGEFSRGNRYDGRKVRAGPRVKRQRIAGPADEGREGYPDSGASFYSVLCTENY
jgi:hypothetical protein